MNKRRQLIVGTALCCLAGVVWAFGSASGYNFAVDQAQAEELRSDSYIIQFGNFNVTSGEKSSASYNVTDTVGQTAAGPFSSASYFAGSGFQYIYPITTFSFSISDVDIDLGTLTPGVHNTASNMLEVTARGAGGYSVYAYELHPLRHSNGSATIPDTTCDAGTCSETTAGVWTNQSIPGFGYNAAGTDVVSGFTNNTYFKQFANNEALETMQLLMTSVEVVNNSQATVTYKAGAAGNQQAGSYQTGIVYVAVPGY